MTLHECLLGIREHQYRDAFRRGWEWADRRATEGTQGTKGAGAGA